MNRTLENHNYRKLLTQLPEHPNILGRENYFISSVLIPFVMIDNELNILFQKRTANIRQGGEICFPGGGFDPELDKDYRDTAIRETAEELGISKDRICIDGVFDTHVNPGGKIIYVFVGSLLLEDLRELQINRKKVEKIFTIPVSFFRNSKPAEYSVEISAKSVIRDQGGKEISILPAKKLGLPGKYEYNWGHNFRIVYMYNYENEVIWGITAEIIIELMKNLSEFTRS